MSHENFSLHTLIGNITAACIRYQTGHIKLVKIDVIRDCACEQHSIVPYGGDEFNSIGTGLCSVNCPGRVCNSWILPAVFLTEVFMLE